MTAANTSTVTTTTGTNSSTEIACSTTTDDIPAVSGRPRVSVNVFRKFQRPGNAANREDAPAMVISAGARARRRVQDRRVRPRGG